jgi:hypothetical protein
VVVLWWQGQEDAVEVAWAMLQQEGLLDLPAAVDLLLHTLRHCHAAHLHRFAGAYAAPRPIDARPWALPQHAFLT